MLLWFGALLSPVVQLPPSVSGATAGETKKHLRVGHLHRGNSTAIARFRAR